MSGEIFEHPSIKDNVSSAMAHYPRTNDVKIILVTTTGGDPDMAQPGTRTPTPRDLKYEPFIEAVPTIMVKQNEATLRYTDKILSVSKDDLNELEAKTDTNLFQINGGLYKILWMRPSPSTWDFFIRMKD